MSCQLRLRLSTSDQINPSPTHNHDAIDTTKRNSACHRLIREPSAFCTRTPHTVHAQGLPGMGPELGEKTEQHEQQNRRQQRVAVQRAGFGQG